MICAVAQPTPDKIEKTKSIPVGKPIPFITAKTIAKISVPIVEPKIWLTGRPPSLEAIVGYNPQPNRGPNPIKSAVAFILYPPYLF